jgi:hypothetical protein
VEPVRRLVFRAYGQNSTEHHIESCGQLSELSSFAVDLLAQPFLISGAVIRVEFVVISGKRALGH